MVGETKKRKTSSATSPVKPATVKLTKEEVYNVNYMKIYHFRN